MAIFCICVLFGEGALAEIDRLWGADPASPDGARLETLLAQVDSYEEIHHPTT